jgi:hypothetical protein
MHKFKSNVDPTQQAFIEARHVVDLDFPMHVEVGEALDLS